MLQHFLGQLYIVSVSLAQLACLEKMKLIDRRWMLIGGEV
jgi:hypothetical protein